jgi:hypothetical protein
MRILVALASVLALLVLLSPAAPAGPDAAPTPSSIAFDRIKSLAGVWHVTGEDGKPGPVVRYRVTAAGSAVEETLFEGTPKEMVTMYHMDGEHLMLTHYCALGNQPRMRAEPTQSPNIVAFRWLDGTNLSSRDEMHMDSLTMRFTDATHLKHEWTMWQDGKVIKTITLDLVKEQAK